MCYFEASWLFLNSWCRDFAVKMASALRDNSASIIHIINLSINAIEDKGSDADSLSEIRFCSVHGFLCYRLMLWFLCLPALRCDCSQSEFVQIVPWPQSAELIQGLHVPKRCSFYLLLLLYMSRCCFTTTKVTRFKTIKGWLPWHRFVNANFGSSCYTRPRLSGSSSSSKYISLQHPYPPRSERKHRLSGHRRGSGEFKRAGGM